MKWNNKSKKSALAVVLFVSAVLLSAYIIMPIFQNKTAYITFVSINRTDDTAEIEYSFFIPKGHVLYERHYVDGEMIAESYAVGGGGFGRIQGSSVSIIPRKFGNDIQISEHDGILVEEKQKITLNFNDEIVLYDFIATVGEVRGVIVLEGARDGKRDSPALLRPSQSKQP